ncbi:MAG: thioredoxin [Leptospiraceae bacterium]|nr:thioredoxin [Leptospiraceae bacterium]
MPVEITEQNFKEKVVDASMNVPILVDFWADWCGPCKMLSPVLEKLERDYGGNFILAKVDTESNQQLAMMFRISSIPDVRLVKEGKVVDGFVGALPEKDIKAFLDKHVEPPQSAGGDIAKLAQSNPLEALKKIKESTEEIENKPKLLWTIFSNHLMKTKKIEELTQIISEIDEEDPSFGNQRRIMLKFLETEKDKGIENLKKLNSSANEKTKVLDEYLAIVENSKYSERGEKKEFLLACFYFLSPDDEVLFEYRRKLSSLIF